MRYNKHGIFGPFTHVVGDIKYEDSAKVKSPLIMKKKMFFFFWTFYTGGKKPAVFLQTSSQSLQNGWKK